MVAEPKKRLSSGDKLAPLTRSLELRAIRAADAGPIVDESTRELELTFSSEQPCARWWGDEVLSHEAGAADLARLNDGAPLLFNHDMDDVIGVIEKASIGADRRGHATVRFARTARADEVVSMINDRVLRNVSFMYRPDHYVATERDGDGDVEVYTATRWEAFEISIVSVPADQSIGVGRSMRAVATEERSVQVERPARANPAAAAATTPSEEESMKRNPILMDAAERGAPGGGATVTPAPEITPQEREAAIGKAREDENLRVREIEAIGARHNVKRDLLVEWISKGTPIAEVRGLVLDMQYKGGQQPVARFGGADIGLTDKEKAKYSMIRAVNAAIKGDWKEAGFERAVSEEMGKLEGIKSEATRGFFMPLNIPFAGDADHAQALRLLQGRRGRDRDARAPYVVGTPAQGGNLVATELLAEEFIEVLRNQVVTSLLGARMLTGLEGNVDIPRQNGQTSTYWVGESVAVPESEATFDKVMLRPKTIGAYSKMSRLMRLQSSPSIEMLARLDLLAAMALGLDLAALSGTGTGGQPTGIANQAGVTSIVGGANGADLTFDHIIQLQYATKFANAPQGSAGYALNSKAIGFLSTQKATTGQYLWDPQGGLTNDSPDRLKGRSYAESQQLRSNLTKGTSGAVCSEIIYGNWLELLIASWGVVEIDVNPFGQADFAAGDVAIRALHTADVGVRHGQSFSVMSDAKTPGF